MTYVIVEPCIGVKDASCVDVCPVDCIHATDDDPMFFIDPDECIDCGACEPECPWQAIFEEVAVPAVFKDDTPLNYKIMELNPQAETLVPARQTINIDLNSNTITVR